MGDLAGGFEAQSFLKIVLTLKDPKGFKLRLVTETFRFPSWRPVKTSAAANHQHEGSVGSVGSPALGTPEHPPHPLLLPTRVPPPVETCTRGRESLL